MENGDISDFLFPPLTIDGILSFVFPMRIAKMDNISIAMHSCLWTLMEKYLRIEHTRLIAAWLAIMRTHGSSLLGLINEAAGWLPTHGSKLPRSGLLFTSVQPTGLFSFPPESRLVFLFFETLLSFVNYLVGQVYPPDKGRHTGHVWKWAVYSRFSFLLLFDLLFV